MPQAVPVKNEMRLPVTKVTSGRSAAVIQAEVAPMMKSALPGPWRLPPSGRHEVSYGDDYCTALRSSWTILH